MEELPDLIKDVLVQYALIIATFGILLSVLAFVLIIPFVQAHWP